MLAGLALPASAYGQCVTDRFAVDACRGGVRNTASLPPGASLDLSFMTPGTLDPRITFTRASTGTYFDATGTMQTAAINAPRWDYDPVSLQLRGLLLEDARTNLLLNSAALVTQSVTTTAVATTLSFYGTGTITYSGAASGSLVGTGTQRVSAKFTPAAGTLTLTVTGSVTNAQLEPGLFVTSYIPTTAATATRSADSCTISSANMSPWFTSPGGSWSAELISIAPNSTATFRILAAISGNTTQMFLNASQLIGQSDGVVLAVTNATLGNTIIKAATTWAAGQAKACSNAGPVATSATLVTGYGVLSSVGMFILVGAGFPSCLGYIRRVSYWPRVLSDAELQQVTT